MVPILVDLSQRLPRGGRLNGAHLVAWGRSTHEIFPQFRNTSDVGKRTRVNEQEESLLIPKDASSGGRTGSVSGTA